MANKMDKTTFGTELDKQLDAVISWAIDNSPKSDAPPAFESFDEVRKKFHKIATGDNLTTSAELEPSEGGPQYVDSNPMPWP